MNRLGIYPTQPDSDETKCPRPAGSQEYRRPIQTLSCQSLPLALTALCRVDPCVVLLATKFENRLSDGATVCKSIADRWRRKPLVAHMPRSPDKHWMPITASRAVTQPSIFARMMRSISRARLRWRRPSNRSNRIVPVGSSISVAYTRRTACASTTSPSAKARACQCRRA